METSSMHFCYTCNKSHHLKNNQNVKLNSSLKFEDFFCHMPSPHPCNFTLSSPNMSKYSRIVYADHDTESVFTARLKSARGRQKIS